MKITEATLADIPALCRLLDVLFSQEAEFVPDHEAQAAGLRLIMGDPRVGQILVAREDHAVIGMVNLLYTVSTALGARVAILEDMVVAPEERGKGIGNLLLRAAIDRATRNGCRRITLLTDATNEHAQRFYRRHGFTVSTMRPLRLMTGA